MAIGLGKSYKSLTQEDKDLIIKLFQKDRLTIDDIIKIIPTTRRAVPKVLKEAGINTTRKNRYTLNEYYFDNVNTERKAYWLGIIASDGSITKTNYFALSMTDRDVIEQLKTDINYTGEVYTPRVTSNKSTIYRINFSSKIFCDSLRALGIKENKSLVLNDFPKINTNLIKHFIRGYFDGDGSINVSTNKTIINNKTYYTTRWNFNIIATYKFCITLDNFIYKICGYRGNISMSYKCNKMFYYKISAKDFLFWMYHFLYDEATFSMKRKYDKWHDFLSAYIPSNRKKYRKLSKLLGTPNMDNQQPILLSKEGSTTIDLAS